MGIPAPEDGWNSDCTVGVCGRAESSQQRLEQHMQSQLSVNDELMSLLRYENKLQREIVKELVHVRTYVRQMVIVMVTVNVDL